MPGKHAAVPKLPALPVGASPDELLDPAWRANELRKRVLARREEARGHEAMQLVKRQHLADKRRRAVVQRWKDTETRARAKIGEKIRDFEKDTMQFLERADMQWSLDIKLRALDRSVSSSTTSIRDALHKLNESEKRIKAARKSIARPFAPQLSVAERIDEELARDLPTRVVSSVSGETVSVDALAEHERTWVDPRGGLKYTLEDLRPIPEVTENQRAAASSIVSECQYCSRRMLTSILEEHERGCLDARNNERRVRYGRKIQVKGAQAMDCCVEPQRPRNFRVGKVTHDTIELLWEPPVFDGGTFIADYVVSLSLTHRKVVGKQVVRTYSEMPMVRTARWNMPRPMAHNGFVLRGLHAKTEYAQIKVAAVNGVGQSPWTHSIEKCLTLPPVEPSRPLFLRATGASARSVSIEWVPPLETGGGTVRDGEQCLVYEVGYTCTVILKNSVAKATSRMRSRVKVVHDWTQGKQRESPTAFTIHGLLGDDKIANITVRAINLKSKLKGAPSEAIKQILTAATDDVQDLDEEIERIESIEAELVDTTFYQGFAQQFTKGEALALLYQKRDEKLHELEQAAAQEAMHMKHMENVGVHSGGGGESGEEAANGNANGNANANGGAETAAPHAKQEGGERNEEEGGAGDSADADAAAQMRADFLRSQRRRETAAQRANRLAEERMNAMFDMRDRHFQWKLKTYQTLVTQTEDHRLRVQHHRHGLVYKVKEWSKRVSQLRPELDRADNYRGVYMDSSVLHNKPQHFLTEGLRMTLGNELYRYLRKIGLAKQAAINMEKEMVVLERKRDHYEEKRVERVAAHHAFVNERKRIERARDKFTRWQRTAHRQYYARWVDYVEERRWEKQLVGKFFKRFLNKELQSGWNKWRAVMREEDSRAEDQASADGGQGTKALVAVDGHRRLLQGEIEDVLLSVSKTDAALTHSQRTSEQTRQLEATAYYDREYKPNLEPTESATDMSLFFRGQGYEESGEWDRAIGMFVEFSKRMHARDNIFEMSRAWDRLGHVYSKMGEPEKAYVAFDRCLQLSREARSTSGVGRALLGLGLSAELRHQHREAIRSFDRAVHYFRETGDVIGEAGCYRGSQRSYAAMNNVEGRDHYKDLADEIEMRNELAVQRVTEKMASLRRRLVGATASATDPLEIERVSAPVPRIRLEIKDKKRQIKRLVEKKRLNDHHIVENERRLRDLKEQQERAEESEAPFIDAKGPHETIQRFKLFEFRKFVLVAQDKGRELLAKKNKLDNKLRTRISNLRDDLDEIYERLDVENGGLMKRALLGGGTGRGGKASPLRFICFNPTNTRGNDVLGECTGGVTRFVAAAGKRWYVFDMDGTCYRTVGGDEEGKVVGKPVSHTRAITAMCYQDRRVYTGSLDTTVRVWELDEHDCVATLEGHTGAISCVAADAFKVFSASSDLSVRIWDAVHPPYRCLHIVLGHTRSVVCIHKPSGKKFVTGGRDCELKVWTMQASSSAAAAQVKRVDCLHSMLGHGCAVTCAQLSVAECVSGGEDGRIIIWSADDGTRLRTLDNAHKGAVLCLRFDVTKIISGGRDGTVQTHDIASGSKLQTLHGHHAAVNALEFDQTKILTASMDAVMRRWPFQGHEHKVKAKKFHILEPNETLPKLCKRFDISIKDFKKWNDVDQARELYAGRRVLVKNGPRAVDVRVDHSPAYTALQHGTLKPKDTVPIGERWDARNMSEARQQELALAGDKAMKGIDGLKRGLVSGAAGGALDKRTGELKMLVAASTNAGILDKQRVLGGRK